MDKILYGCLIALLALSLSITGLWVAGEHSIWLYVYTAYLVLAVLHTWYVFVLLAKDDFFPRPRMGYHGETVAVVIPAYNEEPKLLAATITSVIHQYDVNKHIYVVNDGSKYDYSEHIPFDLMASVTYLSLPRNMGKRYALAEAHKQMQDERYVITIDSDTILAKDAIVRLFDGMAANVGAVSGDIVLSNEKENMLTRMIGAYYWSALHLQRRAESTLGQVACCSGAFSLYRREVWDAVMGGFLSHTFLGKRTTHGEDRHLTSLTLKAGWDVVFAPDAKAYTDSPSDVRGFLRQQLRWRRGFFQEAIFALTVMARVKPVLFVQIALFDLLLPIMALGMVMVSFMQTIVDPPFFLLGIIPSLVVVSMVRHLPMFFYRFDKVLPMIGFSLFANLVMVWQSVHALLTLRNRSWITR